MKFKKITLISLILVILTIGIVSASEDVNQDNLSSIDESVQESPALDENTLESSDGEVLSQIITDDEDNQNGEAVLGSGLEEKDIKIIINTNAINLTNGNSVFVTIKVPKGTTGEIDISPDNVAGLDMKLSKIPDKTTKNGITTYTIRVKDFKNYKTMADELKTTGHCDLFIRCNNGKYEDVEVAEHYIMKVDKKAKTCKLKRLIPTNVWIGPYDRKSGTNKKLTVHLVTYPGGKAVAGRQVKITINGVVYNKKTNSKGLIVIYPPKYLPPASACKVAMKFAGDSTYGPCQQTNEIQIYKNPGSAKSKITASSKTFSVNKTKKYTVKFTSSVKDIKKAQVKFKINGKTYTVKTNSKGVATFNLSKLTKKGSFKGTILYMGDNKHYMAYKNVKLTVK